MPTPIFEVRIPEVISIIDAHSSDLDIRYAWSMIRDHLHGCHFYVDARSILIRPLLPPTNTHPAFELATQRIYMSATLGAGGELERLAGRREIVRLTVPAGWDKHGIGRRFFVFPERSLDDAGTESFILKAIQQAGRALVLVPDELTAKAAREWIQKEISFTTFEARDIEMSKKTFIETSQAVAVVASRYDGIDFPGKECRMLVVAGLPRATNLQERFFITRMGALALLNDRILTRIVQAFGRCTRSATDFAGVIIWGEELHGYLLKRERRDFLHPELQAELEFGIDQSKGISETEFLENLSIFFEHQDAWNNADAAILKSRDALIQKELPGTADLRAGVQHEIDYQYAIWRGDFPSALEACRRALAELKASDLRGYRAIWNYLAGSAAWMAYKEAVSGMEAVAREYFRNAVSAAPGVRWLVGLSRIENFVGAPTSEDSRMTAIIERLERVLEKLGTVHDRKYAEEEKFILEHLAAHEDGRRFEAGHERLGKLLGYEAGNIETKGAPDPWWMVDETICIIFEDYSEADIDSSLNVNKARQVATHPNWVRANLPVAEAAEIVPVLVTRAGFADEESFPHLGSVFLWEMDDFLAWAKRSLTMIREVRRNFPGSGDLVWRAEVIERFRGNGVDPASLLAKFKASPAAKRLKIFR